MSDLVGVIGSGRFGLAMASVLANNSKVLLYSRNPETIAYINENHEHLGYKISKNIIGTHDLERVTEKCKLIFPIVPSQNFRDLMKELNSHLRARHILIHGTKGLEIHNISKEDFENGNFTNKDISSMSEVIRQETNVVRIGCLSGLNLSQEIMMRKPAAAVVASEFDEVVHAGQIALGCKYFFAFHSNDLRGTELAGAFKNIIALASGILAGKELGKKLEALLITRGLNEMIHFGNSLGISGEAFLGTAGIGDLIATATSPLSRNYTFGFYLGQGADVNELMSNSSNTVEGVMTLKIIHHLAIKNKLELPIIIMLYKTIFEGYNIDKAVMYLMSNPMAVDVDFL